MLIRVYIHIVLLFLLIFTNYIFLTISLNLNSDSYEKKIVYSFDGDDIFWVIAEFNENHLAACRRSNAFPLLDTKYKMNWDNNTASFLVESILRQKYLGLQGCCSSGLWCTSVGCYTQNFGPYFENYGWLSDKTKGNPVYSCIKSDNNLISSNINELSTIKFTNGKLNIATKETSIEYIGINNRQCNYLQQCNEKICKSCENSPCSIDSVCVINGNIPSCFMNCAGPQDNSCPCDSFCDSVTVMSRHMYSVQTVHLCTPKEFNTLPRSDICKDYKSGGVTQCLTPSFPSIELNSSNQIVSSGNIKAVETSLIVNSYDKYEIINSTFSVDTPKWCYNHKDCFDNNICTIDNCQNQICTYKSVNDCDSINNNIQLRQNVYSYLPIYQINQQIQQNDFQNYLEKKGSISRLLNDNDLEYERVNFPFSLKYYGNLVNHIGIGRNGLINLPPIYPCKGRLGSFECIIGSSETNMISLWSKNWAVSKSNKGKVLHSIQLDSSNDSYDFNKYNSFHLIYLNMTEYINYKDEESTTVSIEPETFSVSLFEDSSIKLRYHDLTTNLSIFNNDLFGIWGSHLYQNNKNKKIYESEFIDHRHISSGHEITFCPISNIICLVNSCVVSNTAVELIWNGYTCNALTNTYLNISCIWAGGLQATIPHWKNNSTTRLLCPVPKLNLNDGAIITLEIIVYNVLNSNTIYSSTNSLEFHSIYSIYRLTNGEVSSSNTVVRYYNSNSSAPLSCGCNPLNDYKSLKCDISNICGGDDKTIDCNGDPFGSAFVDNCNQCVGGLTGKYSINDCSSSSNNGVTLLSETFILILIVCSMSCILSSISYIIRITIVSRIINSRRSRAFDEVFAHLPTLANNNRNHLSHHRGLTEFERDALGEHIFMKSDESATSYSNECSICLNEITIGDKIRVLPDPCGHSFHVSCIDEWLKQAVICPLCKRSVKSIMFGEDEESESSSSHNDDSRWNSRIVILSDDDNSRNTLYSIRDRVPPVSSVQITSLDSPRLVSSRSDNNSRRSVPTDQRALLSDNSNHSSSDEGESISTNNNRTSSNFMNLFSRSFQWMESVNRNRQQSNNSTNNRHNSSIELRTPVPSSVGPRSGFNGVIIDDTSPDDALYND